MVEPISIINTISQFTVDILEKALITDPSEDDIQEADWKAIAGLVRAGKLQADPTKAKINILIREGGKNWPDVLATESNQVGIHAPVTEIGDGGITTWFLRRFIIEFRIYIKTKDRLYVQKIKNIVYSRAFKALLTRDTATAMRQLAVDDFGEGVHLINIQKAYLREGGGPGTFIWKGNIEVEFLTSFDA